MNIPEDSYRMIVQGKEVGKYHTFRDFNITTASTVHLVHC